MLVLAGIVYPNFAYQATWDSTTWVPFIATFGAALPILILIIALIKKAITKDKGNEDSYPDDY